MKIFFGVGGWFFLSFGCAVFTATTACLSKLMLKKKDPLFVGWIGFVVSIPIFFVIVIIHRPNVHLTDAFWKTIALALPLELWAFLAYLRALKISPLSLTFPLLGFTPVFTILTSSIILKEKLSLLGITGVSLVSVGAYLLNANMIKDGFLEPLKNIYRERGSILMVLVAFIYSITSSLGKKGVLLSDAFLFPLVYYGIFFILLTPLVIIKNGTLKTGLEKKDLFLCLAIGVFFALSAILHFKAISLINVPYMISVKRLSLILSVLYGVIIFKEKNIGYRMLGSLIMVGGIFILLLASGK